MLFKLFGNTATLLKGDNMEIKNKLEASLQLKRMNLNYIKQEVIYISQIELAKKFIEENPAKEYCMRSLDEAMGEYFFVTNYEELVECAKSYGERFLLGLSTRPYAKNIVLLGDIKVDKDRNIVDLTARTDENANHRNVYDKPDFNLHTTLDDDNLWDVPGFMNLIDCISKNSLYNMVVEFGVYDLPLGVKNEKVVIYEVRTNY